MSSPKPNLRVHINQIDYALSPAGFLDNCSLPQVPVVRIYGATSLGKKACVHIHQVYPYFFVDYPGSLKPNDVNTYIRKLSHSLNHAMAISLKRSRLACKSRFIRAVLIVKGIHFYGFHASYSPFLKILMLDPSLVGRAVTIMQSGTIMQTRFRVYESHISFILQFMCDFGLYGCGWIDFDEVWQRGHDIDDDHNEGSPLDFKPSLHYRESRMELELDVASHQILNRHRLSARNIHHKLEIPAAVFPPIPLVPSVRELWEDERAHRLSKGLSPSPDIPIDLSANSRGVGRGWAAEARWWDEIRQRIENEETNCVKTEEEQRFWEDGVMTTFESVEALWEDKWRAWKPTTRVNQDGIATKASDAFEIADASSITDVAEEMVAEQDIDVNESVLTSQEMNQLMDLEDDWERVFDNKGLTENDDDGFDEEALENPDDFNSPDGSQTNIIRDDSPALSDRTQAATPNTPRKRLNPFQDAWLKLAGLGSPASPMSENARTPTKHVTSAVPSRSPSLVPINFQKITSDGSPHFFASVENQGVPEAAEEYLRSPRLSLDTKDSNHFNTVGMHHDDPFVFSDNSSPFRSPDGEEEIVIPETRIVQQQPLFTQFESTDIQDEERPSKRCRISEVSEPNLLASNQSFKSQQVSQPSARISSSSSVIISPSTSGPASIHTRQYVYATIPPTSSELEASLDQYDIPHKIYRNPYYSKESDAPERAREYSGLLYHLRGEGLGVLEDWHVGDQTKKEMGLDASARKLEPIHVGGWEYASHPPSVKETKRWLVSNGNENQIEINTNVQSQIEGTTQENIYGLNISPVGPPDISRIKQDMSIFSLEVFAPSRGNLIPDPSINEIVAVFYSFQLSNAIDVDTLGRQEGKILVESGQFDSRRLRDVKHERVASELELINQIVDVVVDLDPDVVVGWEIQNASWGYLNARASTYGLDITDVISRAPPRPSNRGIDQWGIRKTSTFKVAGRHVLNVWRIMRIEQALKSYTFENVAFHLLHRRMPRYSHTILTNWFNGAIPSHAARILRYFAERTSAVLAMIDKAEIITKTAEFARVFGVDFFSVISRGSQFKVESVIFRIAKPESFVLISPSRQDVVGRQNAAECMPLIMEPLSAFYKGPLLVLDFQSLYPSVMIAYNYCYSTCIGRISRFKGQFKFGVTPNLPQPPGLLSRLQDYITVAPNGIMYLQPSVRKGLLGRMLSELLDTRVMVKQAMKKLGNDKSRRRILDARQLGLKYICNVTYGYTTASFSGRMPAAEIADSIVQTGRETLEKAIRHINGTKKWGAKVVYGDTDSVFVYLPGKTKDQAFRIGQDIADSVTALNPAPIKLRFEKVYLPCVLMAKKRYVGFKYENPDDREPIFDAKGIETVRRDGVPAQHKMVEKCLTILFRTQDLSRVKAYCWSSWKKILENKVSIQDFIFAKEVRLGTYSDKVPPPPGVMVVARRMLTDQNDEPQYGERVPYVIVRGEASSRLVDRSVDPKELLNDHHKHLDGAYYISRVLIPPLERIFNLVGADVRAWYDEMPKAFRADQPDPILLSPKKDSSNVNRLNIDEHFYSSQCLNCGTSIVDNICNDCYMKPQTTVTGLLNRIGKLERRLVGAHQICMTCTASAPGEPIECESLDCPWLFERKKVEFKVEAVNTLDECVRELGAASPSPVISSDSE